MVTSLIYLDAQKEWTNVSCFFQCFYYQFWWFIKFFLFLSSLWINQENRNMSHLLMELNFNSKGKGFVQKNNLWDVRYSFLHIFPERNQASTVKKILTPFQPQFWHLSAHLLPSSTDGWNSNTLATWSEESTPWKRPWWWERLKVGGEGDGREWDGWMASPTRWTWVWVGSGSWWWTGRPGVLQSTVTESQRRLSDWTELIVDTYWKVLIAGNCSMVCTYKQLTFTKPPQRNIIFISIS